MEKLGVEQDGVVYGYTRKGSGSYKEGGRTYKSMNYHRTAGYKKGKTTWGKQISREQEAECFDESDFFCWRSNRGDHWWVAHCLFEK